MVVLGSSTATELFGSTDVAGQSVTISDVTFTVVGVLADAGASSSTDLDDMAVIPLTTASQQIVGGRDRNALSTVYVQAASTEQLSAAYQETQTLLLNLLRGTGTHGLGAMPAASGSLVRPLLDCARAELAAYAAHHRLPIITDPTNAGGNLRARVRHELLPLIEQLRPGARSALARTAAICDSERQALDRYAARLLAQRAVDPPAESFTAGVRAMAIEVSDWSALPTGERHLLLRAWLAAFVGRLAEVDFALIDALDTLAAGRADAQPLAWPRVLGDATAVRCGSRLWLGCWPDLAPWGPLPLGGPMPAGVPVITPDAPLLAQTLRPANYQVRSRRPGDSYQPAGRPRKPLGDWLAELGVPLPLRDRVPLLIDRDTIAWLPGLLPAADYRASSGARLGVVS